MARSLVASFRSQNSVHVLQPAIKSSDLPLNAVTRFANLQLHFAQLQNPGFLHLLRDIKGHTSEYESNMLLIRSLVYARH